MIVDDRGTARSLLEGLARTLEPGVIVQSYADPFEALAQMQLATPDLIITDYRMPGMDGIEFTRRIRAERRLSERRALAQRLIHRDLDRCLVVVG